MFSTGNKIAEGILFVQEFTILIPLAPHFRTASNVSKSDRYPTVKQRKSGGGERCWVIHAVRAITSEHQGCFTIFFHPLFVDDRYRNLGTVFCGSHNPLTDVLSSVVTTEHFCFFFQLPLICFHVVIKN